MKVLAFLFGFTGVTLIIFGIRLASIPILSDIQISEEAWSKANLGMRETYLSFPLGAAFETVGVALALVAAQFYKPKYASIILVALGFIYCFAVIMGMVYPISKEKAYPDLYPNANYANIVNPLLIIYLLPGLGSIVGILLIKPEKPEKSET